MREILFRAKLSENPITGKRIKNGNGEFVEGFYVATQKDPYDARTYVIETDTDVYHIIPETVGQYTGQTDMHHKKIFEGDIIRALAGVPAVVIWSDYESAFVGANCIDGEWVERFKINQYLAKKIEVIGNIHDNSELLPK